MHRKYWRVYDAFAASDTMLIDAVYRWFQGRLGEGAEWAKSELKVGATEDRRRAFRRERVSC